ncbi:MAG: double zinc ribbon domain-containing protein [Nitrospirales bacterium]
MRRMRSFMVKAFTSQSALHALLHLIFPSDCAVCHVPLRHEGIPFICRTCWATLSLLPSPCCPQCGQPFSSPVALAHSPTHICGACRQHPPAYTKAWSLYTYQSPLKEALALLKYRGKVTLAYPLAQLFIQHLPVLPPIDVIMPVPLHARRLREREFNQSALLASPLSQHLGRPLVLGQLIRRRQTIPQTSLTKKERLTNLREAFAVTQPEKILGKAVLLVDDVMTTGTTLHECAKTLIRAGSGQVYGVTLARMM